jgi:uncharacterized protein YidB (DUF937 family)
MARSGFPSMTALLGLLAVAGYQNRDKISEMLNNRGGGMGGQGGSRRPAEPVAGLPGRMLGGQMGGQAGGGHDGRRAGAWAASWRALGGGGLGGLLGGGLGELDQQMRRQGRGDAMDSWVSHRPQPAMEPHDLEAALGPDVLDDLQEQTGLSRQEIVAASRASCPTPWTSTRPRGASRPRCSERRSRPHAERAPRGALPFSGRGNAPGLTRFGTREAARSRPGSC